MYQREGVNIVWPFSSQTMQNGLYMNYRTYVYRANKIILVNVNSLWAQSSDRLHLYIVCY